MVFATNPDTIDAVDDDGWTVAHFAAESDRRDILEAVLQLRPSLYDAVDSEDKTSLMVAQIENKAVVVEYLENWKSANS